MLSMVTINNVSLYQMDLIGLRQKKAHIMEIQINGGTVADKVVNGYKTLCDGSFANRLIGQWNTLRKPYEYQKYLNKMKSLTSLGLPRGKALRVCYCCP